MKCIYPDQVGKHNLIWLIQEFVYEQQHPGSSPCNIPDLPPFYKTITIHTEAVATFHAPSDLSSIGGMKCEHIHAVSCWRGDPGCYDTLFINAPANDVDGNAEDLPTHGIQGLEVACAHLFFPFTLNGVKYPCTLVHWFSHTTDTPSDITGMYTVETDYLPNGKPVTAVVHLDTVFRAVHLLPISSNHPTLSKHQHHEQTLDLFSEFYINQYINYHTFKVVT